MANFMKFRRREARAINSGNLIWSDIAPTDADYVAARGMSREPLGALLDRLKWANDHRAYGRCVSLLGERFAERTGRDPDKRLCHTAIREWLDANCKKCEGRGIIADAGQTHSKKVYRECKKCSGTGMHQHTDFERAHMANLTAGSWKKYERDYEKIMGFLLGAVSAHRVGAMRAFGVFEESAEMV